MYYINGEILYSPRFAKNKDYDCAEEVFHSIDPNESKERIFQTIKEIGATKKCLFDVSYINRCPDIEDNTIAEALDLIKEKDTDKALQLTRGKIEIDHIKRSIRIRYGKYNYLYSLDNLGKIRYKTYNRI